MNLATETLPPTLEIQLSAQRIAGRIVRETLDYLETFMVPGVTGQVVNDVADAFIRSKGGYPSYKLLENPTYPATICMSVNENVAHTPATEAKTLEAGDIVKLDLAVYTLVGTQPIHADSARTYLIDGDILTSDRRAARYLIEHTRRALDTVLSSIKPNSPISTVASSVEAYLSPLNKKSNKLVPVSGLGGHGIGTEMHQLPFIPNSTADITNKTDRFELYKAYAIEPILSLGTATLTRNATLPDGSGGHSYVSNTTPSGGWTPTAHFEHTIIVLPTGIELIT